jgi:hypothetical protein
MKTLTSLYVNDNGRITCIDHMGSYGKSAYEAAPERDLYRTPLDCWERIDADYIAEWTTVVGEAPRCEDCR